MMLIPGSSRVRCKASKRTKLPYKKTRCRKILHYMRDTRYKPSCRRAQETDNTHSDSKRYTPKTIHPLRHFVMVRDTPWIAFGRNIEVTAVW